MKTRKARAHDLTGQRFHRLLVLGRAPNFESGSRSSRWHCQCDCGNKTISVGSQLRNGRAKSCGCYSQDKWDESRFKHGCFQDPLYKVWTSIKQRCFNPNDSAYPNYGGRGISMSHEWKDDYAKFAQYLGDRPSLKHTVERIDNSKGYEPGNIKWATRHAQSRNKRTNRMITHNGQTMCFKDWVKETGISHSTLYWRVFTAKWPLEKAFGKSLHNKRLMTHDGKTQSIRDWAKESGIHEATLYHRIVTAKWPIAKALKPNPK